MRSRKNNQSSILLAANSIIDHQANNNANGSGRPSGIGGVNKLAQKAANVVPIFEGAAGGVPHFHHDSAVNDAY